VHPGEDVSMQDLDADADADAEDSEMAVDAADERSPPASSAPVNNAPDLRPSPHSTLAQAQPMWETVRPSSSSQSDCDELGSH